MTLNSPPGSRSGLPPHVGGMSTSSSALSSSCLAAPPHSSMGTRCLSMVAARPPCSDEGRISARMRTGPTTRSRPASVEGFRGEGTLMRAVVIHAARDLRIEDGPAEDPAPGQVEIAIEAGGICGSDLHYYNHGG